MELCTHSGKLPSTRHTYSLLTWRLRIWCSIWRAFFGLLPNNSRPGKGKYNISHLEKVPFKICIIELFNSVSVPCILQYFKAKLFKKNFQFVHYCTISTKKLIICSICICTMYCISACTLNLITVLQNAIIYNKL